MVAAARPSPALRASAWPRAILLLIAVAAIGQLAHHWKTAQNAQPDTPDPSNPSDPPSAVSTDGDATQSAGIRWHLSTFFLVEVPGVDVSLITNASSIVQVLFSLVFIVLSPIPFWLIGRSFSWTWDVYVDFKKAINRIGKRELSSQILDLRETMIASGRYL